ncbi:hypothetical protein [Breoghania corrubedonensis]|uniref:hypothetical protein n=1 Tax=Breoghania corrubedonensis TaxID=665038 RepID=UPI0011B1E331|nr:hypothetical protein [Breoghania corrubedonensis]
MRSDDEPTLFGDLGNTSRTSQASRPTHSINPAPEEEFPSLVKVAAGMPRWRGSEILACDKKIWEAATGRLCKIPQKLQGPACGNRLYRLKGCSASMAA